MKANPHNTTADADTAIARCALRLVNQAGLANKWLSTAALPTLAELEAEFGGYLLQQARHMVGVNHAHHGAATGALDEVVGVVAPRDALRGLQLECRASALGACGCRHFSLQVIFPSI